MIPTPHKPIEIIVGSRNPGKLREIADILRGLPVRLHSLAEFPNAPEVAETGSTFQENAEKKALELASHFGKLVLADDSGLEVDALGGAPGVLSARFSGKHGDDAANNRKLLEALNSVPGSQRTARFRCVVALAAPGKTLLVAEGTCEGRIAFRPSGSRGFGYDPLFRYPPANKTFGELDEALKNQISHRANALRRLKEQLPGILAGLLE